MKIQPFVALVAALQISGGLWSMLKWDWKMAVTNIALGVANAVFSTMAAR